MLRTLDTFFVPTTALINDKEERNRSTVEIVFLLFVLLYVKCLSHGAPRFLVKLT